MSFRLFRANAYKIYYLLQRTFIRTFTLKFYSLFWHFIRSLVPLVPLLSFDIVLNRLFARDAILSFDREFCIYFLVRSGSKVRRRSEFVDPSTHYRSINTFQHIGYNKHLHTKYPKLWFKNNISTNLLANYYICSRQ